MVPLFLSYETYEFAVRVHVDPEPTTTLTVPVWPEVFIAPVKSELSVRFSVRVETLSTNIVPVMVWSSALMVTFPPFEPEVPQVSVEALRKYPEESLFLMVTSESVIVVVVLVT